jgi:hypothetical protein
VNPGNIALDDLALLQAAIRFVPDEASDAAWSYAATRLRPIAQPTVFDVREVANEMVAQYGRHYPQPFRRRRPFDEARR